jgi:NAD-dependent oxidoreductase involved in siderophore biosynthesis
VLPGHPVFCKRRSSSLSGLRRTCVNTFFPYRKRVTKFVAYQQHSVICGERPHRNRTFPSPLGDASIAATNL